MQTALLMIDDDSHLYKHLAQEGHDKRWVHTAESSDGADCQLSDLKHLVVKCHKQRLQVLGLGEVGVKALIEGRQDAVANVRICRKMGYRFYHFLALHSTSQNFVSQFQAWQKQPLSFTWIRDANNEQLAKHVRHHLHGGLTDHVTADQLDGRRKQAWAGAGRLHPDFLVLAIEEVVGAVADKLSEGVSWREREDRERE